MRRARSWLAVLVLLTAAAPGTAQALPQADDVAWEPLAEHCDRLLRSLQALKTPLPAETEQALRTLLKSDDKNPSERAAEVQKLLDPYCLVAVSINPESRVKAVRGPAAAELRRDQQTIVLLKVCNQAGVGHALAVTGPQIRSPGQESDGRWLEATVVAEPPLKKTLSGQRLEYVILRLTPREAGKREATLKFDVGQGTQDLGFRAEVPVLFVVK